MLSREKKQNKCNQKEYLVDQLRHLCDEYREKRDYKEGYESFRNHFKNNKRFIECLRLPNVQESYEQLVRGGVQKKVKTE